MNDSGDLQNRRASSGGRGGNRRQVPTIYAEHPVRRRLLVGRTRIQPHYGSRVPHAHPHPRRAQPGAVAQNRQLHPQPPAGRRLLGAILRRSRQPEHLRRMLHGVEAGRRPSKLPRHYEGQAVHHLEGRRGKHPRLHQNLARHARPVPLEEPPRHAPGNHVPPQLVPPQHLRILQLGPRHHRPHDHHPDGEADDPPSPNPPPSRNSSPPTATSPNPTAGTALWPAGAPSSTARTRFSASTKESPSSPAATRPKTAPPGGYSPIRRPTAPGAASSPPGSTPSSASSIWATPSTIPP